MCVRAHVSASLHGKGAKKEGGDDVFVQMERNNAGNVNYIKNIIVLLK